MDLPTDFYVEPADWRYDRAAIEPIRLTVFVEEQAVPEDEEFDEDDPRSEHFLARDLGGEVIGTARLTEDGRIGRMAVAREWRGRGVGAALLGAAVEAARARGLEEVRLSAQVHAIPFYERYGFIAEGPEHDEVGIPHRWMRRRLAALDVGPVARRRRGDDTAPQLESGRFEGPAALAEVVLELIRGTRQRLDVFTHDLEAQVLDRTDIVAALSDLLVEGLEPEVRVVVLDSARALELGHRWIGLGQKRSSAMGFRKPPPELATEPGAFLIADRRHVVHREFADSWTGYVRIDDPHRARQLLDTFDAAWEHGTPDPNTLRLDL